MTWELRASDCLDAVSGLASLADASVDSILTDPPYSADLYTRTATNKGREGFTQGEKARMIIAFTLASGRIGAVDDIIEPCAAEFMRICRRWMLVFSDIEIAPRWRAALGDWYLRTGVWVKTDPMPQITGDRPAQGFEACTIAHRPGKKRWNGGGRAAVWTHGTGKGAARPNHPCPKPLSLMTALVEDFTDRGELICDPFAGSGTTGVAAIRGGRRFIGWERDAQYAETARRRLADAREQLSLFAAASDS